VSTTGILVFRRYPDTTEALWPIGGCVYRTAYVLGFAVLLLVFSKYVKARMGSR